MDNKLLILLVIALMIYTYVTCYSGSATELFAFGPVNNPNVVSGDTPEGKAIILAEAKGSWYKSCGVESADWNSSLNKLTATCTKKKGRWTSYPRTSIKCENRKFKNKKGKLNCE